MEQAEEISRTNKYPAKAHAASVAAYIERRNPTSSNGIIYLEGEKTRLIEDNDEPVQSRCLARGQLSSCAMPDCYLTYNTETAFLTLFIPPIDPENVIWSGLPLSPAEALELYDVDAIRSSNEVN